MARDSILYVAPIMPQPFGNGLAMRAAMILEALARRFEVHLFVVPVAGDFGPASNFVRTHTMRVEVFDLASHLDPLFGLIARVLDPDHRERAQLAYPKPLFSRFCTGDSAQFLFEWSGNRAVTAVHVMRLYLAPLAVPFLRAASSERPFCVLDLDDDDVRTCRRLMRLHRHLGDCRAAAAAAAEAQKYRTLADAHLRLFDRALVSSGRDARRLAASFPGTRFAVVPNGYPPLDDVPRPPPSGAGPLRLLFVGTFGYFPNLDAALFLCREVLPALCRSGDRDIRIDLVGAGNTVALAGLARYPGVTVHGFVEDLAPFYAAADVAVVPVRVGGGTRIKILEAFAHRVPVVTTRIGAEGIDAADGQHLLIADDAEAFARACHTVKQRPELAADRANHAAALLVERYSPAQVDAAFAAAYRHDAGCGIG
jgi:glycosyltransferase involved in cell wall biosynthesis